MSFGVWFATHPLMDSRWEDHPLKAMFWLHPVLPRRPCFSWFTNSNSKQVIINFRRTLCVLLQQFLVFCSQFTCAAQCMFSLPSGSIFYPPPITTTAIIILLYIVNTGERNPFCCCYFDSATVETSSPPNRAKGKCLCHS